MHVKFVDSNRQHRIPFLFFAFNYWIRTKISTVLHCPTSDYVNLFCVLLFSRKSRAENADELWMVCKQRASEKMKLKQQSICRTSSTLARIHREFSMQSTYSHCSDMHSIRNDDTNDDNNNNANEITHTHKPREHWTIHPLHCTNIALARLGLARLCMTLSYTLN